LERSVQVGSGSSAGQRENAGVGGAYGVNINPTGQPTTTRPKVVALMNASLSGLVAEVSYSAGSVGVGDTSRLCWEPVSTTAVHPSRTVVGLGRITRGTRGQGPNANARAGAGEALGGAVASLPVEEKLTTVAASKIRNAIELEVVVTGTTKTNVGTSLTITSCFGANADVITEQTSIT